MKRAEEAKEVESGGWMRTGWVDGRSSSGKTLEVLLLTLSLGLHNSTRNKKKNHVLHAERIQLSIRTHRVKKATKKKGQ